MTGGGLLDVLLEIFEAAVAGFPESRKGKNRHYTIPEISRGAFAVFFCQSPSFLAHQQLMEQARGNNNGRTLFGIERVPSDNHIRGYLDGVDPHVVDPGFHRTLEVLKERGALEGFRGLGGTIPIALDGTKYFASEKLHCDFCSVAHRHDGHTLYSHSALLAAVFKPGVSQVLALPCEYISPQDGTKKQDSEWAAALRWLERFAARYSPWAVTIVGDDLYAHQPIIVRIRQAQMDYLFTAKESSHRYLYEEIESLAKLGGVAKVAVSRWSGSERLTYRYRFLNGVRLRSDEASVQVNWCELTITADSGEQRFHTAYITSHLISKENVAEVVATGRGRWKIENEDINTLKTKGYHFEHNFGHGKKFLSQTLLSLNLLAFLFHTALELLEPRWTAIRQALPRRDTFFQHLSVLTQYVCFDGWDHLLRSMMEGLHLADPGG
jgi:hypothetical protein